MTPGAQCVDDKRFKAILISIFLVVSLFLPSAYATQASPRSDGFIEGYAVALLKTRANMEDFDLFVDSGVITVSAESLSTERQKEIGRILSEIPGGVRVKFHDPSREDPLRVKTSYMPRTQETGFLPEGYLFSPLLAAPRWPHFSASYHYYDNESEFENVGAVSFGGRFGLYRGNINPAGQWQLSVAAGVFSIFDLDAGSYDLVNSDFFIAFPQLSYRWKDFSVLTRLFHQSSHLGDEYLLRDRTERVNLSYEGVDLNLSYDLLESFRIYAGGGYLFHRDPPDLEAELVRGGFELKCPVGFLDNSMFPVAAVDVLFAEENDWDTNFSVRAGAEFRGFEVTARKYQLLLEYYKGYSPNGQFYSRKVEYTGLGLHIFF